MTEHVARPISGERTAWQGIANVQGLVVLILLLIAFTLPLWVPASSKNYVLHLGILVMLSGLGGLSFNLLGGYAGQVSFGHAAFYGVSAYTFAILFENMGVNSFVAMFVAALVSALLCIPMGLILFRLRGAYFALSMLAFAEVIRLIAQNWKEVTNGAAGLLFFSPYVDKAPHYWILLSIVVATIVGTWLIVNSKFGSYFLAIREDQDVAETLGINTTLYKLFAFIPSAFIMGLAGAFYASYFAYLEPNVVFSGLDVSLNVLIVTLIGGIGTLLGPLVGAAILVLATEVFINTFGQGNALMAGVLLIAFILFLPDGVVGRVQRLRRKRWQ